MSHTDSEGKVHFDPPSPGIWHSPFPKWVTVTFWAVLIIMPAVCVWLGSIGY